MAKIYITGHRHPDLDSICSAIAYANLKNLLDSENEYIPIHCSRVSENVESTLKLFDITLPIYMRDVYPKVKDVMWTDNEKIDCNESLAILAKHFNDDKPSAMPIYKDNEFYGLITIDDIVKWSMDELSNHGSIKEIPLIKDIMGKQASPVDASSTFDEVKGMISQVKVRGFAVYEKNQYIGYVTRRCFLKAPKYNVILVDHNEPKQSIRGIETANVLEIIDHHRIDAVKTELPVFIDAEPLGSTCTIIYQLYLRHNKKVNRYIAKVLLTGILSDTLMLKSPTTTNIDKTSAIELSNLSNIKLEEFGKLMYSNLKGLGDRNPIESITADFKKYQQKSIRFGIGQCEVTTLMDLDNYKEKFLKTLNDLKNQEGLDWAVLLITDVMKENSILLVTDFKGNKHLPYVMIDNLVYDLPGILSRKKQLLPEIINMIEAYM